VAKAKEKKRHRTSSKPESERGLTRVDSRNTHGWMMRLYHQGIIYTKLFSDGVYGSTKKALKAARKYREQLAKKLGIESLDKRRRVRSVSTQSVPTGVVGVYRGTSKSKSGQLRHYYSASWSPKPNELKTKSFSIAKYGEAKAFELAVEYRKKMMEKIVGVLPEATAPDTLTTKRYMPADAVMKTKNKATGKNKKKKRKKSDKAKKKRLKHG